MLSVVPQDLSFNQLPTLPAAVDGLTQLQVLNLLGNPLAALPRTCSIRGVHEGDTKCSWPLTISGPCLMYHHPPVEMQALTELRKLKVSNVTKRKLAANPQLFLRYLKPLPFKPSKL